MALVLGGQRWATVEVEIYTLIAHELALAQAASLAVAMLALTVGMAWAYAWVERRLASPARISASEREAYRVARALDQADRALSLIARKGESQAAKIASQTLRRLQTASEPPAARLTFARSRLELLSLRPEPWARAEAAAALAAMA